MEADLTILPTDPRARAALYRQWIATDEPQATRRAPTVVRQAPRESPETTLKPTPEPTPPATWLEEAIVAPPGAVAGFIRAVTGEVIEQELPLDARRRLVERAGHLGLSRFDANLVIAAIQHRLRRGDLDEDAPRRPARRVRLGVVPLVLIVVGVELLVGSAVLIMLRS